MDITYRIEQKRHINGAFPGPKSVELAARRTNAVAAGRGLRPCPSTSRMPTAASSSTLTATPSSTWAPASP